jgi:hypothetical protein
MNRLYRITPVASTVGLSWLGMQVVHEVGHVLAAWACGEEVYRVVLHPLAISRTDTSHERHPLLVIWGGPLIGVLLPLGALGLSKLARPRLVYMFRFFAGFCLIANGSIWASVRSTPWGTPETCSVTVLLSGHWSPSAWRACRWAWPSGMESGLTSAWVGPGAK